MTERENQIMNMPAYLGHKIVRARRIMQGFIKEYPMHILGIILGLLMILAGVCIGQEHPRSGRATIYTVTSAGIIKAGRVMIDSSGIHNLDSTTTTKTDSIIHYH